MPARNLVVLAVVAVGCLAAWYARERDRRGQRVNEVLALVDMAYIEPVNAESLLDAAMDGIVSNLDEHSAFVRGDVQQELEAALDQQFGGVGLELMVDERSGALTVATPVAGGPAWRAGVRAGDRITAIDGATTAGLPLRDVVTLLRGRPGEPVTLTAVSPDDDEATARDIELVRELVQVESVHGDRRLADGTWEWWLEGEPGVAILRISGFGERTAEEFDAALVRIAAGQPRTDGPPTPLRGILLDLRGNAGGLVTAAVDVCDRFLDEGVIVSIRDRRRSVPVAAGTAPRDVRRATAGAVAAGVPIAVLVDGLTASAAEIVAACLQDHRRGTVVGSRTYGKGTVQSIMPLSGGGLLKLTTAEYLRPDGRTIDRRPDEGGDADWGVTPDEGFVIAPSGEAVDRLVRWRRRRDASPGAVAPGPPDQNPRDADDVLRRALESFPPASGAGADLGGEEETARDAHESLPSGV